MWLFWSYLFHPPACGRVGRGSGRVGPSPGARARLSRGESHRTSNPLLEDDVINAELDGQPELVNSDPHGGGWYCKVRIGDPDQVAALMDATAYGELAEST